MRGTLAGAPFFYRFKMDKIEIEVDEVLESALGAVSSMLGIPEEQVIRTAVLSLLHKLDGEVINCDLFGGEDVEETEC